MFTKVLVPLDGTEVSEGILPVVTGLARDMKLGVVLARAIDVQHMREEAFDSSLGRMLEGLGSRNRDSADVEPWRTELVERIERELKAPLDSLAGNMAREGIDVETAAEYGPASETIIGISRKSGCDLIAMSTRGRNILTSGLLGSVTYKVIHESPMPVLAIAPERARSDPAAGNEIDRVIVPLDGSAFAETVLPYATALARRMGLNMTLLRVLPDEAPIFGDSTSLVDMLAAVEEKAMNDASSYLARVARRLRRSGLSVDEVLLHGKASSGIIEYAKGAGHGMIALTTHGRSGVSRLLLGSVAEAVVRESGCPVLVVRPAAGAQGQEAQAQPAT